MKETVNVYDFDKTILPYDSTAAFYKWCARRWPRCVKPSLPMLYKGPMYVLGLATKTEMKDAMYGFLTLVPDVDAAVEEFWAEHYKNLNGWYLEQKRPDDIIISASPDFHIRPVTEKLGVRLIASRVSKYTGITEGRNNDGEEKVRRLHAEYPEVEIADFYSDSLHDSPLALLARRAYLVKPDRIVPWPGKGGIQSK